VQGGERDVGAARAGAPHGKSAQEDGYAVAHALWQALTPWLAVLPLDAEGRDLIARLDALLPTPQRPASLDSDPEAAEVLAQALVGQMERAADADLYLGRDLARAMDTVADLAARGCAAAPAGRGAVLGITALYFEDSLDAPLSILAAGPAARIAAALAALDPPAGDPAQACADLAAGFADARREVFP